MKLTVTRARKPTDIAWCQAIRSEVFIDGQGISFAVEQDGLDDQCIHFLGRVDNTPIAAARLLPCGDTAKVQRVAVREHFRGTGAGRQIMEVIISYARNDGFAQIVLGAQVAVIDFYQRLGFSPFGDQYEEAGIPHQNLRLVF